MTTPVRTKTKICLFWPQFSHIYDNILTRNDNKVRTFLIKEFPIGREARCPKAIIALRRSKQEVFKLTRFVSTCRAIYQFKKRDWSFWLKLVLEAVSLDRVFKETRSHNSSPFALITGWPDGLCVLFLRCVSWSISSFHFLSIKVLKLF